MRKSIFYYVLISLLITSCASQKNQIGARIGANFATVGGDEAESFDNRTGIQGGIVGNFGICESWALEPGLIYSAQGSDYSESVFSGEYKLDYLNVPVLALYEVGDGFTLEAGPQFGFLLSAKDKYSFDGESMEDDVKDFTKSFDLGVNLGAGYQFDNGIKISASYNLGLTDLNDSQELADEGVNWKNNVIQISLAYYIKLGNIKGDTND